MAVHTPETQPKKSKLSLTVGADKFDYDGEHTMAEVVSAFKEWGALREGNADLIARAVETLKAQGDKKEALLAAHQQDPPPA